MRQGKKRFFRAAVCAVLAGAMVFGTLGLAACGGKGDIKQGGNFNEEGELEGGFVIRYWEGGFGHDHIQNVLNAFLKEHPKVQGRLEIATDRMQVISDLVADDQQYALYMHDTNLTLVNYAMKNFIDGYDRPFLNLKDVYDSVSVGTELTIGERMNDDLKHYIQRTDENGDEAYYGISYGINTYGFTYIEDLLQKYSMAAGLNGRTPYTTDELAKICDEIKNDSSYSGNAFIAFQNSDYWRPVFTSWWVQWEGIEGFRNFCSGLVKGDDGMEYSPEVFKQRGRLESFEEGNRFLNYDAGYIYKGSSATQFMTAQEKYLSGDAVFMVNGGWLENEMSDIFNGDFPHTLQVMKTPILSDIIDHPDCEGTIENDAELSALIAAIDAGSTALSGTGYDVSQKAFDKVKEARDYIYVGGEGQFCEIPVTSTSPVIAKEFLKFMYSEKGIAEYSRAGVGAFLPIKNYDYTKVLGDNVSAMYRGSANMMASSRFIMTESTPLTDAGLGPWQGFEKYFYIQNPADRKTPQECVDEQYNYYTANNSSAWNDLLTLAGLK